MRPTHAPAARVDPTALPRWANDVGMCEGALRMKFVAVAAATVATVVPALGLGMTRDELIEKNLAARGGIEQLRALQTIRFTGKVLVDGGSFQLTYAELRSRTGGMRAEYTLQGMTKIQAWDGHEGWHINPFGGRKEPERLSPDDAKVLAEASEIEGPLLDWRARGHEVEYLGTEDVDGTLAHKLRVRRKNGDEHTIFLDPDQFLEIRVETRRTIRGVVSETVTDLGDYAAVAGVIFPFSREQGEKGSAARYRIELTGAEANAAASDSIFRYPGAGPAAAEARLGTVAPPAATPTHRPAGERSTAPSFDPGVISGLPARNIGSAAMSGRIAALAGRVEPNGKTTLFVGAASGGVWKSEDGGTTFKPVFDDQPVQSIGAIALDPTNPKIVWVGTGEAWTRNSVSIGAGIFKSTDGGETFAPMGLPGSERISRIEVDPRNGNIAYACVPGPLWSDSTRRGLYKTTDGGKAWRLVLKGANASTGCASLALDPKNPDIVLASTWDFRRKGWTFRSGGDGPAAFSGSGLHRSADGGATWTEITPAASKGFPAKPYGRIAVAFAPSNRDRVYACVESPASGLFVSDDGGKTWEARDRSQWMVWRPFYFAQLVVDPGNPDRLFKTDGALIASDDAGKSFTVVGGFSGMHGDVHDVWIDPKNSNHVFAGDDGGLWLSYDGGNRWWKSDNLPISQFYHVSTDDDDPYRVYGGLQDNASWVGDSEYPGGITSSRWENLYDGDGFWMFVDPADPDYVYAEAQGGAVARINRKTHEARNIQPKALYGEKLRFNWNAPIALSPHEKGTIYVGAQFLFRSRDHGHDWERISPDLTTNDPAKQKQEESGGVTVDNSVAEMHTTIYAIAESPKRAGLIWVGTDDGNVQLTQDGGRHWKNVVQNIAGLPPASWVSSIEPSRHDPRVAYVTFDRHTFGDMEPYVFVTRDLGTTWKAIVGPAEAKGVRGYAHVIREDLLDPGLLFLGTEFGLWASIDGGASWAKYAGSRFPAVAVRDIAIHPREHDLILGTHGRGIWIIDDISPLRKLSKELLASEAAFVQARPIQQRIAGPGGWVRGAAAFSGENPPEGAVITYYQRSRHLFGKIKLEILDPGGKVVDAIPASPRRGLNRVLWSMRERPPHVPPAAQMASSAAIGPRVLPGSYTVRISKGDAVRSAKLAVQLDRRATFTLADRKAQLEAVEAVKDLFGDESKLVERVRDLRLEVQKRLGATADGALRGELSALDAAADDVRKLVVATKEGGAITGEERLREHTDALYGALLSFEGRPAPYLLARTAALRRSLADAKRELDKVLAGPLLRVNERLHGAGMAPIAPPSEMADRDDEDLDLGGVPHPGSQDPDAMMQPDLRALSNLPVLF